MTTVENTECRNRIMHQENIILRSADTADVEVEIDRVTEGLQVVKKKNRPRNKSDDLEVNSLPMFCKLLEEVSPEQERFQKGFKSTH